MESMLSEYDSKLSELLTKLEEVHMRRAESLQKAREQVDNRL